MIYGIKRSKESSVNLRVLLNIDLGWLKELQSYLSEVQPANAYLHTHV